MQNEQWTVRRWSGRGQDSPRDIYTGDESSARARYDRCATALRQGLVKLINPAGEIVTQHIAYRNRTRW